MTFHGTPKWAGEGAHGHDDHAHDGHAAASHAHDVSAHDDHAHDDHGHGHGHGAHTPHESPASMLAPILLLAVGAIAAGYACRERRVKRSSKFDGTECSE
jgi:NADH-quinone oxidoreductase subunit L